MHEAAVADKFGGGVKADGGKLRLDLLPFDALSEVAEVMTLGAAKYSDRNWEQGMGWMRLVGAALRHLFAFARGEDYDNGPQGDGKLHTAHAATCLLFLVAYQMRKTLGDDRPGLPPSPREVVEAFAALPLSLKQEAPPAPAKPERLPIINRPREAPPGPSLVPRWDMPVSQADMPPEYRVKVIKQTGSVLALNGNKLDTQVHEGDDILISMEGVWHWRTVRDIGINMVGRRYNVPTVIGQSSIMMVPHEAVFAIKFKSNRKVVLI